MFKFIFRIFSILFLSVWSFTVYAIPIVSPGDFVRGGASDGTNFTVGDAGFSPDTNNWPGGEDPTFLIDGVGQKYLNFAGSVNSTGAVFTPSSGGSTVNSITFWTANDAEPRDPASYELYGTTAPISAINPGDAMLLSEFTLISSGLITLPASRNAGGSAPLDPLNSLTVPFANTTAYSSYLILFPTVKDSAAANSMQLAEVQLDGTLTPIVVDPTQIPTLSIWGLGLMSVLLIFISRRRLK